MGSNLALAVGVGAVAAAGGATAYLVGRSDMADKRTEGRAFDARRAALPSEAQQDFDLLHVRPTPFGRELEWGLGTAVGGLAAVALGAVLVFGSKAGPPVLALGGAATVFGVGAMAGAAAGGFIHNH